MAISCNGFLMFGESPVKNTSFLFLYVTYRIWEAFYEKLSNIFLSFNIALVRIL